MLIVAMSAANGGGIQPTSLVGSFPGKIRSLLALILNASVDLPHPAT